MTTFTERLKAFFTPKRMGELTIKPSELGNVSCLPPRRRLFDLVPSFILNWTRKKFQWPAQSPFETWLIQSLFLRLFYQNHLTAQRIEESPKPFFHSAEAVADPDKAAKVGEDTDPWRWS